MSELTFSKISEKNAVNELLAAEDEALKIIQIAQKDR